MDTYLATIMMFGGNFTIKGWAFCYGQLVSIAQNTALFSLLGTTFGGDGQTTFALPDLRGRVPIGQGQGPGLSSFVLGETGGSQNVTLLITNMPAHSHTASLSSMTVAQSASTAAGTTNEPGPSLVPAKLPTIGGGPSATTVKGYAPKDNTTTLAPAAVSGNAAIGISGGSQPFNIQNPYLAVNYLIALEGIFPTRD